MDARFATEGDERPAPVTDDGPMNLLRKRWIRVPAGFVAMSLASMLAFHVGQDAAQVFFPHKDEAAKPAPAKPVINAGTSPWRAQLGAFGVEANARNLWSALGKKYPAVAARQPVYVKAGAVTRLQTAGFANKGHAENFCATVRKGGQACMVVAK